MTPHLAHSHWEVARGCPASPISWRGPRRGTQKKRGNLCSGKKNEKNRRGLKSGLGKGLKMGGNGPLGPLSWARAPRSSVSSVGLPAATWRSRTWRRSRRVSRDASVLSTRVGAPRPVGRGRGGGDGGDGGNSFQGSSSSGGVGGGGTYVRGRNAS